MKVFPFITHDALSLSLSDDRNWTCLSYVFDVEFDVKHDLHVMFRKDGRLKSAVPPQTTDGASVAGPICVGAVGGGQEEVKRTRDTSPDHLGLSVCLGNG